MKRQFSIFLIVSVIIAILGLTYGSRIITDLTLLYPTTIDVPGTKIILRPHKSANSPAIPPEAYTLYLQDAQDVVSKRLEEMYLHQNYQVNIRNSHQLEVVVPADENTPYTINVITRIGEVEFVDGGNKLPLVGQFIDADVDTADNTYQTLFTGREITTIVPPDSDTGEIFYQFQLQPTAAERVADFIRTSDKAYACLVIDRQIVNCSTMYHLSGNTLDILPNLAGETGMTLADLAIFLKSGPLPVSLEVITN